MSLSATCESVAQKRTISSLLAGRVLKKPKLGDGQRLQEEAIQLLEQHQDLSSLFKEAGAPDFNIQNGEQRLSVPEGICGSLLLSEVKRQAAQTGVSVPVLSVKLVLGRLEEITEETDGQKQEEDRSRGMFTSCQRVQLRSLLQSSRELLSLGALCPKLLWQEYRRCQKLPKLEVVYYLHSYNIISLKYIIKSDEAVGTWLSSQMKALSEWTPPHTEEETKQVQQKLLSALVGFLVGRGFEQVPDAAAADGTIALLCCSVMDDLLCWVLDIVDKSSTHPSAETGAKLWLGIFDSSLCGVSATEEAVQRFFTHFLTQTLTYKSQLSVSDAISLQHEWTFAKASCCLTALFRKLAVVFSVEQLLGHLQRVLETHEVNWKHVLCFLSTLLVYEQSAQSGLKELLSRLLNSAFQSYELEKMITAFLLARQGVLEGPAIFPSYSDWFKMSFGSSSGYHTNSKKSLVFLLKFLSDLVSFEPPQYLKVHILNPPYVPVKHRSLLMEYVSLAKTRLADLKESVEDMGLYEDVCGAAVQPECQAEQDVEKAVSLFRTTGRISATVMEASIFRRPYFLTRFLPALLKPRLLPVKPDALMSFIEALKKADKIPAALFSSYLESCQKQRQQRKSFVCLDTNDDPLEVVRIQLQDFRELVAGENRGEMSAQLSRISHTLSVVFPGCPDVKPGSIVLNSDSSQFPDLHLNVVNILLRNFCQCLLNTSRSNPPNKFPSHLFTHSQWASMFVGMMLGNTQLLSCLLNRLWDLFHNQGPVLTSAHVLGLAVFVVHLQASMSHNPLVQLASAAGPELIPFREVLGSALVCSTLPHMLFCVRLCVAAVCFGIVTRDSMPEQQAEFIPSSLYKKLLFLIPRLMPEARGSADGSVSDPESGLWSSVTDGDGSWTEAARRLWRHEAFQELQLLPQYQLRFSEWLHCELRVQRSEDALSDAQRQEYQQWACMDLYLPLPEEQGGCGGDMKKLCSHLLDAVMDHQLRDSSPERIFLQAGAAETGSCLPDLLSRLQELVYEMEVSGGRRLHLSDFLFELLSPRCPPTGASASMSISTELGLQQTLQTWNRVLLSLPAVLFIRVKTEGERTILDMKKLMEHVNQHQRRTCAPSGLLPSHITAHFLKGLMYACVQCKRPGEELDRVWSDMSLHCPLMLVSAAHWWQRLSAVAFSLWRRLSDGESPPQQLQLLTDCQDWACSLVKGHVLQMPSASALLLAASLHRCWQSCEVNRLRAALNSLPHQRDERYKQVLVFLLFLHVNDYLSALLDPEEESPERARVFCSELVSVLVTSADWLLVFTPDEPSIYPSVTLVTSDRVVRLFPWAFCSLMFQENAALLQSAAPCPGFLQTAVLCYISALQLYLDGQTPTAAKQQVESSHILSLTKQFLLSRIPQTPPARLSSSRLRQLESRCADLDPELAAALSMQLDPHSPEMDFL